MMLGRVRALALDVDGVLTDGGVWWGPRGTEWKRFHFADIMGVSLARKAGLVVTLISGEDSQLVDRFATKLNLTDFAKGCKDKAAALRAFANAHRIGLGDVGFMGDDVNDLDAIRLAGWSAAPADAHRSVRARVHLVTRRSGGNGAVREAIDHLLAERLPVLPAYAS
jgi:3-deoxy-D-manno-octulosonate 8-phosphate phosphatase (KDO 8-P phosphatase)